MGVFIVFLIVILIAVLVFWYLLANQEAEDAREKEEREYRNYIESQQRTQRDIDELANRLRDWSRMVEEANHRTFVRLRAEYPIGVQYAKRRLGWSEKECIEHKDDIIRFNTIHTTNESTTTHLGGNIISDKDSVVHSQEVKKQERRHEIEEAERRRKQQEKESALQHISNAVSNWNKIGGGVPVYSLFYYYPTTCTDVFIDTNKQQVRKWIWDFKNGRYSPVEGYIKKVFEYFFGKERLKYLIQSYF